MTSLQLAKHARQMGVINEPSVLYKHIMKELPRVLTIYDIDIPMDKAKSSIRKLFYEQKDIKDPRVTEMLVETGYFNLETAMLQHKQKAHLMRYFDGYIVAEEAGRKRLSADATIDEQFARN
eukprot:Nitzschia sp. Nitz4//scaffold16_size188269//24468//24964//NITZ4_001771-RA/size188269-augustus-gene-0.74-mRNA-1//1//CDS//3329538455//2651//frame0